MSGYGVLPKTNCPHVAVGAMMLSAEPWTKAMLAEPCSVCKDPSENWICLQCHSSFCSRYVNVHAGKHFESSEEGHALFFSLCDHSTWCFDCDSYVDSTALRSINTHVNVLKFGADSEEVLAAIAFEHTPIPHQEDSSLETAVPIRHAALSNIGKKS